MSGLTSDGTQAGGMRCLSNVLWSGRIPCLGRNVWVVSGYTWSPFRWIVELPVRVAELGASHPGILKYEKYGSSNRFTCVYPMKDPFCYELIPVLYLRGGWPVGYTYTDAPFFFFFFLSGRRGRSAGRRRRWQQLGQRVPPSRRAARLPHGYDRSRGGRQRQSRGGRLSRRDENPEGRALSRGLHEFCSPSAPCPSPHCPPQCLLLLLLVLLSIPCL